MARAHVHTTHDKKRKQKHSTEKTALMCISSSPLLI
jgi:hypothetical protein